MSGVVDDLQGFLVLGWPYMQETFELLFEIIPRVLDLYVDQSNVVMERLEVFRDLFHFVVQ
ncbi:hypothetical protein PMIN06_006202 [Paraphaeosphaeria minitans]